MLNVSGAAGVARAPAETTVTAIAQGAPGADTITRQPSPRDTATRQPSPGDTVAAAPPPVDTLTTDTTQAVIEEPPPVAADESYQTIFDRPRAGAAALRDVMRAYSDQPYRPLRRGEFYSAGFLTEGEHLPWGRVVGTTEKSSIPRLTDRASAIQFQRVVVQPPSAASYHVGDSLLLARIDRDEGDWGDVVVPLGVARVVEVARKQLLAEVVLQFGRIHDGHLALPLEPFKDPGEARPTLVTAGLRGGVITERDLHTIAV